MFLKQHRGTLHLKKELQFYFWKGSRYIFVPVKYLKPRKLLETKIIRGPGDGGALVP